MRVLLSLISLVSIKTEAITCKHAHISEWRGVLFVFSFFFSVSLECQRAGKDFRVSL